MLLQQKTISSFDSFFTSLKRYLIFKKPFPKKWEKDIYLHHFFFLRGNLHARLIRVFMVRSSFFRNSIGEYSFLLNKKPEKPSPLELDYSIVSWHFREIKCPGNEQLFRSAAIVDVTSNRHHRLHPGLPLLCHRTGASRVSYQEILQIRRKGNRCHLTSVKMVYTG